MTQSKRKARRLDCLSERHIYVMASIYYDGRTQEEVADELDVSQQWVSQLLAQAEKRLAEAGLPLPSKVVSSGRVLTCQPSWMDRLTKNANGTFRSGGGGEDDTPYKAWN